MFKPSSSVQSPTETSMHFWTIEKSKWRGHLTWSPLSIKAYTNNLPSKFKDLDIYSDIFVRLLFNYPKSCNLSQNRTITGKTAFAKNYSNEMK